MISFSTLRTVLTECKNIAIIGAKDKEGQPVNDVGRYLMQAGYTIFPVHPVRSDVWGLKTYKTLADILEKIDVVDVFRASSYCADHAREVLALPYMPKLFWLQLGIVSAEARALLQGHDITYVEDLCLKVEHKCLFAGPK